MKKIWSILLAVVMLCSMCVVPVGAENYDITPPDDEQFARYGYNKNNITVTLNGNEIQFDQPPIIKNNRTLVPMRAIFEAMDYEVYWDGDLQQVDVYQAGDNIMTLWIAEYEMWTESGGNITLDVPPQIINDRTLVPVRAISEALDCDVDWDDDTQTVIIENGDFVFYSIDNALQKKKLELFIENEFEARELTAQGEPYNDIDNDAKYVTAYHKIKDYAYIDIDKDGCDELIVSSEERSEDTYPPSCFSVWDCNSDGSIKCVLAKYGQYSRAAYRYFIAEYNGKVYVLERTGIGNSGGRMTVRNLYVYDGKRIKAETKVYAFTGFISQYDDEQSYTINGEERNAEEIDYWLSLIENEFSVLYDQFGFKENVNYNCKNGVK